MRESNSPASPKGEEGKLWAQATKSKVDHVKDRQEQVRQALADLEAKEQDRIAQQIAEQQRQQARAEALERKRQREALLRAEEERKAMLAADLKEARRQMEAMKDDEKAAVKASTAKFKQKTENDRQAREMTVTMKAMDDAVSTVGLTASRCMHENRMKFSSVKVCEMRLAMRETRPQTEAFRDEVEEALEKELQALSAAREELFQCAKAGEQVKIEIVEVQSLLTTGNSRENVKNRLTKSSSLPSLVQGCSGTPSTEELLRKGVALVDKALEIDAKGNVILLRSKDHCDQAQERVFSCFQDRNKQTGDLKKSLETHKNQVASTIKQAEQRLQMLKMRAHKTPESPRSAGATQDQMRQVEDLIRELKQGKKNLDDDFRQKTSSFKVDRSCINLTKIKAGSHVGAKKVTVE